MYMHTNMYMYVCMLLYMCIHSNIYILIDVCNLVLYILYIYIHNKNIYIYKRELGRGLF